VDGKHYTAPLRVNCFSFQCQRHILLYYTILFVAIQDAIIRGEYLYGVWQLMLRFNEVEMVVLVFN
jgi:hypothetical protein